MPSPDKAAKAIGSTMLVKRICCGPTMHSLCSLRWHDPDQVIGSQEYLPLSPSIRTPLVDFQYSAVWADCQAPIPARLNRREWELFFGADKRTVSLGTTKKEGRCIEIALDKGGNIPYNGLAIGVWRSLVSRLVRVQEAPGSNPGTPTRKKRLAKASRFFQ